jgi:heterotetrameric sarcosine oxidase gamma subunit
MAAQISSVLTSRISYTRSRHRPKVPVAQLRSAIGPNIGAVTPLSHSLVCISIEGTGARTFLDQSILLDLHPEVFRTDDFAMTCVDHTPALLIRAQELTYHLYVMQTFAQWTWDGLIDGALRFGYEIVPEH